jgi:hypothetical protein
MKPERFNAIASVMIAVVTVLGAAVACLASGASNRAGNKDFDGLTAAINAEETIISNAVTVYEHFQAYVAYQRYNELGNLLFDEAANAPDPATAEALDRQRREVWGLAQGLQFTFFPPRYLDPDGSYDTQRELDEEFAEAAQQKDITPGPHFEEADNLRFKANVLTSLLIVLAIAFWFFTVAQAIKNRLKYLFGFGGFAFTFMGLVLLLIVEVLL